MTGEGLEWAASVQENHGVALSKEVLRRGGAACADAEVVDETHSARLERHDGAAGGDERHRRQGAIVGVGR